MFQNPCLYAISFVTIWDKVNKLIIYLNNDNLKTVFPARAKKKKKKARVYITWYYQLILR